MPIEYKAIAAIFFICSLFGGGYHFGSASEEKKCAADMGKISQAAAIQSTVAQMETVQKLKANQEVTTGYEKAIASVNARHISANTCGLHYPATNTRSVPSNPAPRLGVDAAAPQSGSDSTDRAPSVDTLTEAAAKDALQLMWLQDYVHKICK